MQSIAAPREAWIEWGGEGRSVVFGHANGFPPETYRVLLEELCRSFSVASFAARPLWPGSDPEMVKSWRDLADDLGGELKRRGDESVLGIGHSLGSVLGVMTAMADPARFKALALVDPVIFTGALTLFWGVLKGLGFGTRLPLIQGARRRRDTFRSFEEVRSSYEGKSVFATWDRQVFDDYIRSGFVETDAGEVRLRYPKAWESRIFELTPSSVWRDLKALDLPMLVVRGAGSDTFTAAAADRMRRELPKTSVVELAGTSHFVPMEKPREVAGLIADWAREIGA